MKTNNDLETGRHATRNWLIKVLYEELLVLEGTSKRSIFVFLETITGLGEIQLRKILRQNSRSSLSEDDLSLFLVLLQRIWETRGYRTAQAPIKVKIENS